MVNMEQEREILKLLTNMMLNSNFKGSDVMLVHASLAYLSSKQKELNDKEAEETLTKGEGS